MSFNELSPELIAEAKSCESPKELAELAEKNGIELSEETLDGIAGGWEPHCSDFECTRQSCSWYACSTFKY